MHFMIRNMSIKITTVDLAKMRFVIDIQQPVNEMTLGVTIQINKSEESKIDIQAEIYKGLPF